MGTCEAIKEVSLLVHPRRNELTAHAVAAAPDRRRQPGGQKLLPLVSCYSDSKALK